MNFRVITLLCVVAFVAAWLATLSVPTRFEYHSTLLGESLRRTLWSILLVIPVVALICLRGRRQAFFLGVLVILAIHSLKLPEIWLPATSTYNLSHRMGEVVFGYIDGQEFSEETLRSLDSFVYSTFQLLFTVILCGICGLIAVAIYDHSRKQRDADSG